MFDCIRDGDLYDHTYSTCCLENKVLIESLGRVDAILWAMRSHPIHAGVQEQACAALYRLAVDAGLSCFSRYACDGFSALSIFVYSKK